MQADAAEIGRDRASGARPKDRLRTLESLDGRTIAARRARELANGFEAELGHAKPIGGFQRLAVERAATLVALSEDARVRRLAGDADITLDDLVRIDGAAVRAVKALGIKPKGEPAPLTLVEHLAGLATEAAGA